MGNERYGQRRWLWEFVEEEGIVPTHKASEQSLRRAAIWRKPSWATPTACGSRFVEALLPASTGAT
jgi:hypothetical protein